MFRKITILSISIIIGAASRDIPAAGGSVTDTELNNVICKNVTTGQSLTIKKLQGATSWDCTKSGLQTKPGDTIKETLTGVIPQPSQQIVLYSSINRYDSLNRYDGNLGGRVGADNICRQNKPDDYDNVHAFISVSIADQLYDFPSLYNVPTNVPIKSLDGIKIVDKWADLWLGFIPISLDQAMVDAGSAWWSGTQVDGKATTNTCYGWRKNDYSYFGSFGRAAYTDGYWINVDNPFADSSCNARKKILCIAY